MSHYNLISTITELPRLVGCHDFPNDQQGMNLIKIINDFINEQYRYSGAQVKDAFTMAVKRELYLDGKRVDPSTFGQFLSVNVIGQVLTAYKESKQTEKTRPTGYNPIQLNEYKKELISDAESWELVKKFTLTDGVPPFAAPYRGAYNHLVEIGAIKGVKVAITSAFRNMISPQRDAVEKYLRANVINKR